MEEIKKVSCTTATSVLAPSRLRKCNMRIFKQRVRGAFAEFCSSPTSGTILTGKAFIGPFAIAIPEQVQKEALESLLKDLEDNEYRENVIIASPRNLMIDGLCTALNKAPLDEVTSEMIKASSDFHNLLVEKSMSGDKEESKSFLQKLINNTKKEFQVGEVVLKKRRLLQSEKILSRSAQIIALWNNGMNSYRELAIAFGCSKFVIAKTVKQYKINGSELFKNEHVEKKYKCIDERALHYIERLLIQNKGLVTARQLQYQLKQDMNIDCSIPTIYNALKVRLNYARRLSGKNLPIENTEHSKAGRYHTICEFLRLIGKGFAPVCIDETGFSAADAARYIWVKKGAVGPRSTFRSRRRINIIAAITYDEVLGIEFHGGATNQVGFISFLAPILAHLQTLQKTKSRSYFIFMDNATYHKTPHVHALIAKYGLPCIYNFPFSCFLNPIELFFQRLKGCMTFEELCNE
jgi:transposase